MATESLTDLNLTESDDSLEELAGSQEVNKGHTPSNKNRAAYGALMSGENDPVATYQQAIAELEIDGESSALNQIENEAKTSAFLETKAAFMDFLSSDNFSEETARAAAQKFLNKADEVYNTANVFSAATLADDSEVSEPKDQEFARISMSKELEKVNQYKKEVQYLLNSEIAKANNTDVMGLALDFAEILLPFNEASRVNNVRNKFLEGEGAPASEIENVFSLLGERKKDLRDRILNTPPEKRLELAQKLVDAINSHDKIVLMGENELTRFDFLKTGLEEGHFGDLERYADNIMSLVDAVGIGSLIRKPAKKLITSLGRKAGFTTPEFVSAWKRRLATKTAQPSSVAENVKDTNPAKSRALHEAAEQDTTGEVSEAAYGTSREDAIAGDILPEALTADGRVRNRTHNPQSIGDQADTPAPEKLDIAVKDGGVYYFEEEKKQMRSHVYNDFQNAIGLRLRHEMSQFGDSDTGFVKIRAVYGGTEGGYASAQSAVDKTKFALRQYGIRDEDITILKRGEDGEYYPTKGVPQEEGDYLAQVEYDYSGNPMDVDNWATPSVKRNWLDRIGLGLGEKAGSMNRHLFDAHSMLHPNITFGASVNVDKAAGLESKLLTKAESFSDKYSKLPKERQLALDEYIKEANARGIPLKETRLKADGFSDAEITALKDWKEYWDTMYWLENKDLARSLRNRKFEIIEDSASDTRLFARRVSEQKAKRRRNVYDLDAQRIRQVTPEEVEDLYRTNGTLAELRTPMNIDGEEVGMVLVRESEQGTRLRGVRDDDKILNYRNGYYTVHYKNPQFVVKRVKDKQGNVLYEKAVAAAGDIPTAKAYMKGLEEADGEEYFVRGDIKKMDLDSDDYWNLQTASGRVAQRARGKRLEDASGPVNVGADHGFIMGPVDSMIHAARSTASRVAMRPYLEATKERFLNQYKDILPKEKGIPRLPSSLKELKDRGKKSGASSKEIADAITTLEYIRFIENGYWNSIDDGIKAAFRGMADALGEKGFGRLERFVRKGENLQPTAIGKASAFHAYLATNPLRQFIVQSHQSTLLTANFPKYVLSQKLAKDTGAMSLALRYPDKMEKAAKIAGRDVSEMKKMVEEFRESGLLASVDRQSLVEGTLTEFADQASRFGKSKLAKVTGRGFQSLRKAGFDSGEILNMLTSWLAHRDRLTTKLGRSNLSQGELEKVAGEARNYTLNMNFAGDMPYNRNALGLVFQFMQVPHKALLQMTNRSLTRSEKARLAGYQAVMFGLPVSATYSLFGESLSKVESEETRELLVQGLEGYMLNKTLSLITDKPTRTDFSSLAPADMYGSYDFIESIITSDITSILTESPAGQLYFGNNPRITNAFKSVAQYFGWAEDYGEPVDLIQVAHRFGEISSGYSNLMKAKQAQELSQIRNGMDVIDTEVGTAEAIWKAFGFATIDEGLFWLQKTKNYEDMKEFTDDVRQYYRDLVKHVSKQNRDMSREELSRKMFGTIANQFKGKPERFKEIMLSEMRRDLREGDASLAIGLLRSSGWRTQDEIRAMIIALPNINEEQRQEFLSYLDDMDAVTPMEDE